MSSRSYSESDLLRAVEESKGGLSYRKAAARYGVPKSTVCDHATGKVSGSKRGPPTVLNQAEEQMLVDWALHMADIGYGRTREQLCATVKYWIRMAVKILLQTIVLVSTIQLVSP